MSKHNRPSAPLSGGAIPDDAEDLSVPANAPGASGPMLGEMSPAEVAAVEQRLRELSPEQRRAILDVADTTERHPTPPQGFAMFHNPTADTVKVSMLDGDNRPRSIVWRANDYNVVPLAYARLMKDRAPQLVETGRTPVEIPEE